MCCDPDGRLYVGSTADLERRLLRHRRDEAGWTRGRDPREFVHSECLASRAEAMRRKRSVKRGKTNRELRNRFGDRDGRAHPSTEGLPEEPSPIVRTHISRTNQP